MLITCQFFKAIFRIHVNTVNCSISVSPEMNIGGNFPLPTYEEAQHLQPISANVPISQGNFSNLFVNTVN